MNHIFTPARLAAVIFKPGFYPSASAFTTCPRARRRISEVLQLCVEDDDLFEQLAEFRPTHLTAYASMLHEIARQIEAGELA